MKRVDLDPEHPASPEGAPFLCHGCHQISVLINNGRNLRKPTVDETQAFKAAQDAADQMPSGTLTPAEIDRVAADVRRQMRKKH